MYANDLNALFGEHSEYDTQDRVDPKPYKDVDKRQALRHPCANKYYTELEYKMNAANVDLVNQRGTRLSQLVATCDGTEKLITLEDAEKVIPLKPKSTTTPSKSDDTKEKPTRPAATPAKSDDTKDKPTTRTTTQVDDDEDGDFEGAEKVFEREPMSKELFEALYKGFEGMTRLMRRTYMMRWTLSKIMLF